MGGPDAVYSSREAPAAVTGDANERGEATVPEQPTTDTPSKAFGPNEWLVDELYEQLSLIHI